MASKKKSLDQAQKEQKTRKKNSDRKRKKFYAGTILESDFDEVKKQFPYIERDSKGIYYIDRAGERKEIQFPYLPILDDDSCKMIVFRKKTNQGEFVFQIIDNMNCITNILENNGKKPIAWHIAPNRKVQILKNGEGHKIYTVSKGTKLLPTEVLKLTKSNDTKLHKVIMSIVFPEVMQEYREENDKHPRTAQIDHLSGNELDCRIRNMHKTTKQTNLRGKTKIDMQMLRDRTCIYYKQDADGNYIYNGHKYIFVFMLGQYTKEEYKRIGTGEIVQEDNRKGNITQYNFIKHQGGTGNIVIASFNDFDCMNEFYKKFYESAYNEEKEGITNIDRRNESIITFFDNYLNQNAEKISGLEQVVLLANTNETADGFVEFDNISTREKGFLRAKKRGLILDKEIDKETGKERTVVRSIANQRVNADNIIDILYPYFDKIFKN